MDKTKLKYIKLVELSMSDNGTDDFEITSNLNDFFTVQLSGHDIEDTIELFANLRGYTINENVRISDNESIYILKKKKKKKKH